MPSVGSMSVDSVCEPKRGSLRPSSWVSVNFRLYYVVGNDCKGLPTEQSGDSISVFNVGQRNCLTMGWTNFKSPIFKLEREAVGAIIGVQTKFFIGV